MRTLTGVLAAAALLIGACSSEPNQADMRDTLVHLAGDYGLSTADTDTVGRMVCGGDVHGASLLLQDRLTVEDAQIVAGFVSKLARPAYCPEQV